MKPGSIIRVLVADDSALMRNLISRLLGKAADILVAATARDGEDAVQKAIELKPDVVTMDINMPKLDGISAMQIILAEKICPVIMLSSLTQQGAVETFECLELGAFDFVAKPEGTVSAKLDSIAEELIGKVRAAAASGGLKRPRPAASPPARPALMAHGRQRAPLVRHPAKCGPSPLASPPAVRRPSVPFSPACPPISRRDFPGTTHAGGIHPDLRLPAAEGVRHRSGRGRNRGLGACRMLLCGEQQSSSLSLSQTERPDRAAPPEPAEDTVRACGRGDDGFCPLYLWGADDWRAHDRHWGRRRRSDGQDPRGRWSHHRRVGRKLRRVWDAVSSHRAGWRGDRASELGIAAPLVRILGPGAEELWTPNRTKRSSASARPGTAHDIWGKSFTMIDSKLL